MNASSEPSTATPAPPPRITDQAHLLLRGWLRCGDHAVDATCGNGKDTLLLAELCGREGCVYACDVQESAIASTRAHLAQYGCLAQVQLIRGCHSDWENLLPPSARGKVRAFVYNLGYLPHGDKALTTQAATTLASLEGAVHWLAPEAAFLIVAYPGHPAGVPELDCVRQWCAQLSQNGWQLQILQSQGKLRRGPELYWLIRSGESG